MNLKNFKKLSGDASFRQFFRTNNSVLVYSKIQKRSNLLNYDAVNKILIKNKILAPWILDKIIDASLALYLGDGSNCL